MRHTFFHDVRRELVLRQRQHFTAHRTYQFGFVLLFTVFCEIIKLSYLSIRLLLFFLIQSGEERDGKDHRIDFNRRTQYVLNHVIPVLVLNQLFNVLVHFVKYRRRLFGRTMFEYALNDPASVRVCGQRQNLVENRTRL